MAGVHSRNDKMLQVTETAALSKMAEVVGGGRDSRNGRRTGMTGAYTGWQGL